MCVYHNAHTRSYIPAWFAWRCKPIASCTTNTLQVTAEKNQPWSFLVHAYRPTPHHMRGSRSAVDREHRIKVEELLIQL